MFGRILAERPEMLSVPGLTAAGDPWSWGGYSSAILVSAIGLMMWPHLFMKAFTARDDRTLRRTVVLFPTFQLFLIPVFLIGFAGVLLPESPPNADFILPFLILRSELPVLVVGLFRACALSASMSTGDALLHAAASVTVEDGIVKDGVHSVDHGMGVRALDGERTGFAYSDELGREALDDAGRFDVAYRIAQVFPWQIDFWRDLRRNDA